MKKESTTTTINLKERILSPEHPLFETWTTIENAGKSVLSSVLDGLSEFSNNALTLSEPQKQIIELNLKELTSEYLGAWVLTDLLAQRSAQGNERRSSKQRMPMYNNEMREVKEINEQVIPHDILVTVLDGTTILRHRAGLKEVVASQPGSFVVDLLGSATSLNAGAHNPWISVIDHAEDFLGIRDNFCVAYHAAVKQGFALPELSKLHPRSKNYNWEGWKNLKVYTEASGSVVNSHAIKTSCAFVEKKTGNQRSKLLAVDGTWCAGVGAGTEATGFNTTAQLDARQNGNHWVDRDLPLPIKENKHIFLQTVKDRLERGDLAGVIIEPVVGDAGIVPADPDLIKDLVNILSQAVDKNGNNFSLPIIVDCVQQGTGRTGNYWGTEHLPKLEEYEGLILTTAKSASNGQPFGFSIIPEHISKEAYPYGQVITSAENGSLLRALVTARIFTNPDVKDLIEENSLAIDEVADEYLPNEYGDFLRGMKMNRGLYVGSNQMVEVAQFSLFMQDGLLTGALPETVRIQPMLLNDPNTTKNIMRTIFNRLEEIRNGQIPQEVSEAIGYSTLPTGLAVNNTS